MINTTCNSTQDVIDKLESLKGKTKIKIYQKISYYYDEMNIRSNTSQFEEDPFFKNAEGISKFYHEVLLLMKL